MTTYTAYATLGNNNGAQLSAGDDQIQVFAVYGLLSSDGSVNPDIIQRVVAFSISFGDSEKDVFAGLTEAVIADALSANEVSLRSKDVVWL